MQMRDGAEQGAALGPGVVVAGRYRLARPLGRGGMGSVWVAWHLGLNTEVALKFIDFGAGERESLLSRFRSEALAIARVKSPHVIGVLDYGYDEALGRPFLAMELLAGESLGDRLEREGRLPLPDVVKIVGQTCRGLGKAHKAGIVHRDIKPDNIFLCPDEDDIVVKVLDFGVAKATLPFGQVAHHTTTGALIGTPLYMSPEQALGGRIVDHRSDLFSLGMVAYHCLTGQPPFDAEGLGELIMQIASRPFLPPTQLCPGLPPGVERWVGQALEKDPARRFQSAREMSDALLMAVDLSGKVTTPWSTPRGDLPRERGAVPLERTVDATPSFGGGPMPATFGGTVSTRHGLHDLSVLPFTHPPLRMFAIVGALLVGGGVALSWWRREPPLPPPSIATTPTIAASAPPPAPRPSVTLEPLPMVSAAPVDAGAPDAQGSGGTKDKAPAKRGQGRGKGGFQL